MAGCEAFAKETEAKFSIEEQSIEFHNQEVKLFGGLILPKSEGQVPAVVFVHGAGRQNRESYREIGEHFAGQGIAALIYDKRGVGQSSGTYESIEPYENLVNDVLSAVELLKHRKEIDASQIGIWGLSQGAYISAAAATRSPDIQFVMVVGADVADGMMFYYRDNLFRKYGLSNSLRDVAEKIDLVNHDLMHTFKHGLQLSSFVPRSYSPPDKFVHPVWSHVKQPVLAMWGQLDQHIPVGESVAGLKNSLAVANNQNWTIEIVPRTNHDLKISETGEVQSESYGYPADKLQNMTNWAWGVFNHPSEIGKMKMQGDAPEAKVLPKLASYETLRWFGNGIVQASLWLVFLIIFSSSVIANLWSCLAHIFRGKQSDTSSTTRKVVTLERAIFAIDLVILVSFSIVALLVIDQMHPSCPFALKFIPILGTLSVISAIIFLIVLARTPRDPLWTPAKRIRFSLDVFVMLLFIPYMLYWNLIGFRF